MRKLSLFVVVLLLALLAVTNLTAVAASATLSTALSGLNEFPNPGDPDGSGTAVATLDSGSGTVCYRWYVQNIAPATAAHIHRGAAGVAGPVVVNFTPPTNGASYGCVTGVSASLINEILANPSGFYFNVHNAQYPSGALRGQLQ